MTGMSTTMRNILLPGFLILGLGLAPLVADAAPADASAPESSARARILGALDLPLKAQALRKAGVDEPGLKAGLKAARDKKLHAAEAADLLDDAVTAAKEHGPVGNFGAFVKERLDEGLRGKALSEAIRQEHATRGKKHEGKGPPDDKGNSFYTDISVTPHLTQAQIDTCITGNGVALKSAEMRMCRSRS